MKKNYCKTLITLAVTAFIGSGTIVAVAEGVDKEKMPAPGDVEKEVAKPAGMFPLAEDVVGGKLDKLKNEYLDEKGWTEGFNPNPKGATFYIGWKTAEINALKNSVIYGQKRIAAFERAFMDAKGEFVRACERHNTTNTIRSFIDSDDNFTVPPQQLNDPKSRMKLIKDRVITLTEAKLDKELEKMGKDPNEFQNKPITIKQKMMEDSIHKSIKTSAFSSVSGLRVLYTVEDDESVGVLIIFSQKMRQIARAITDGHTVGVHKSNPKASIFNQIKAQTGLKVENLYMIHGLRVMTDDNGDRALVAFGQSAPQITNAQSRAKQKIKIQGAKDISSDFASGIITDFINSSVLLNQETTFDEGTEIGDMITGELKQEYEQSDAGQKIEKFIKQNGSSTLKGETVIHTWQGNHPITGHVLVGTIKMWSPASAQAVVEMNRPLNPQDRTIRNAPNEVSRGDARTSPRIGDDDADF
jgi:hypothetical protein